MTKFENPLLLIVLLLGCILPADVFAKKKRPPTPIPVNTNFSAAAFSVISGGFANQIGLNSPHTVIAGGSSNNVFSNVGNAVVAGGWFNRIGTGSSYAVVGGGAFNIAGYIGTVAGGANNQALGPSSSIGGGYDNVASGSNAAVSGGWTNLASGHYSVVGGGQQNGAVGSFAVVPGGSNNLATNNAFAAGTRAKATNVGAFVWADSADSDFASTASNQFIIRASGGVGINTNNPGSNVALAVNGVVQIGSIQVFTGSDNPPTNSAPNGSLYIRTNATTPDTALYIRVANNWVSR